MPRSTPEPHPALAAMRAEFKRLPPRKFASDFVYDRERLKALPPGVSFAWYIYPSGTHMLIGSSASTHVELVRMIACEFPGGRWFLWTGGGELQATTTERVAEWEREVRLS